MHTQAYIFDAISPCKQSQLLLTSVTVNYPSLFLFWALYMPNGWIVVFGYIFNRYKHLSSNQCSLSILSASHAHLIQATVAHRKREVSQKEDSTLGEGNLWQTSWVQLFCSLLLSDYTSFARPHGSSVVQHSVFTLCSSLSLPPPPPPPFFFAKLTWKEHARSQRYSCCTCQPIMLPSMMPAESPYQSVHTFFFKFIKSLPFL